MDYEADRRFGAHLRDLRKRQQLSQAQLAARLQLAGVDLTRSALANRLERLSGRQYEITSQILSRLLEAFALEE